MAAVAKRRLRRAVPRRTGAVVVLILFMVSVLLGMVAFGIDVGYIVHARTELQRTADSCALAAAARLPDQDLSRSTAVETATDNRGTIGPELSETDVVFGHWNRDTARFSAPAPSGKQVNAVQVTLRRTEASGNPLRLFFAQILGSQWGNATATATAMYDHNLCGPFIGIEWISVPGGAVTDSYNSDEGPYVAGLARDRGSLCSDGPIAIDGNTYIRGDARSGKGHKVTLSGNPVVTGSIGERLKPLNMPPVDATEAAQYNDNGQVPLIKVGNSWVSPLDANRNLYLDGNKSLTLPPGTYYFNNLTLAGQAELYFSGPTEIYLTGNLSRAGGATFNNSTKIPGNVQIKMTGGTALITSYDAFHGVLYGPNTNITLDGSSDYFGAIVGKTLTITGNAQGHYDEALGLDDDAFPQRTAVVD